jgi:S1-C subfamily serine protease
MREQRSGPTGTHEQLVALQRWKRAVVHLEGAADSEGVRARMEQAISRVGELTKRGAPLEEVVVAADEIRIRDLRFTGTATLVEDGDGRKYLITARHVLRDDEVALREVNDDYRRGRERAQTPAELTDYERESFERHVFGIVFRVPSLDEVVRGPQSPGIRPFLMNLGAGAAALAPYTYSAPELDLAVISLSRPSDTYREFEQSLAAANVTPIALADIGDGPSAEGAEIFTVGFPASVSPQAVLEMHAALRTWQSSLVALPNFAFGRISLLHEDLPYFWGDLSIYPGNSGGPVVEGDRLVGVVSAQAIVPVEFGKTFAEAGFGASARIPFGRIIKAAHVRELLAQQAEKDRAARELLG